MELAPCSHSSPSRGVRAGAALETGALRPNRFPVLGADFLGYEGARNLGGGEGIRGIDGGC